MLGKPQRHGLFYIQIPLLMYSCKVDGSPNRCLLLHNVSVNSHVINRPNMTKICVFFLKYFKVLFYFRFYSFAKCLSCFLLIVRYYFKLAFAKQRKA